jgi:hypothetical protein
VNRAAITVLFGSAAQTARQAAQPQRGSPAAGDGGLALMGAGGFVAWAQPGDRGDQRGQAEVVQDGNHPGLGVGEPGPGVAPTTQRQVRAFQCPGAVRHYPGGIAQRGEDSTDDPQARALPAPPGQLAPDRGLEPRGPQAADPGQVTGAAVQHHRQRRASGRRPERAPRRAQHRRPGAFQQIPDLIHLPRRLGGQPVAARPQMAQPRPHRIGRSGS